MLASQQNAISGKMASKNLTPKMFEVGDDVMAENRSAQRRVILDISASSREQPSMPSTPKRKATVASESPRSSKRLRLGASVLPKQETASISKSKAAARNSSTPELEGDGPADETRVKSKESKPKESKLEESKPKESKLEESKPKESKLEESKPKESKPRKPKEHAISQSSVVGGAELTSIKIEAEAAITIATATSVEIAKAKSQRPRKPRQTKEEKEASSMPLAARSTGLRMHVGAHVSAAKGVQNAITNAVHIGGNALALFLKSQRKWANPPLSDEHCDQFHARCADHGVDAAQHVLPHGSYLVNLAQADATKAQQAYDVFLDDLQRCERLGIGLYNFHPGNTNSQPRPEAIGRIAAAINRAHRATKHVKPVLENMAGAGNVVGAAFEDLRDIIALVDDKARIGVCLDTCHAFAAGYDLRSAAAFRATLAAFDATVGAPFLCALHLNDSKAPLASRRDLHQNIGLGFLGLRAFHHVMNEPRFETLPLVLETPIEVRRADGSVVEDRAVWAREIKLLESLIGMDPGGAEFEKMEADLAAQGAAERAKYQEQADRKMAKGESKAQRERKKKQKKGKSDDHGSDDNADDDGDDDHGHD